MKPGGGVLEKGEESVNQNYLELSFCCRQYESLLQSLVLTACFVAFTLRASRYKKLKKQGKKVLLGKWAIEKGRTCLFIFFSYIEDQGHWSSRWLMLNHCTFEKLVSAQAQKMGIGSGMLYSGRLIRAEQATMTPKNKRKMQSRLDSYSLAPT